VTNIVEAETEGGWQSHAMPSRGKSAFVVEGGLQLPTVSAGCNGSHFSFAGLGQKEHSRWQTGNLEGRLHAKQDAVAGQALNPPAERQIKKR
jgi:hypothetical protein